MSAAICLGARRLASFAFCNIQESFSLLYVCREHATLCAVQVLASRCYDRDLFFLTANKVH